MLNYVTFSELCATLLTALAMTMFDRVFSIKFQRSVDRIMNREAAETIEMPEPLQVLNLYLQLSVLCNILKFVFSVLSECGGWCRFAMLNSPMLYAPYLYTMAVSTNILCYSMTFLLAFKDNEMTIENITANLSKQKRLMAMVPAAVIVSTLMAVKVILFIPMAIIAIFPAIVYPHIFVVVVVALGSITVITTIMSYNFAHGRWARPRRRQIQCRSRPGLQATS